MNYAVSLPAYLLIGVLGGLAGARLKVPAGTLIGAMMAVICFKLISRVDWELPKNFPFVLQVLLGVTVGATFHPEMLKVIGRIIIPVIMSTLFLVGTGFLLAVVFSRMGLLDMGTAYLGTSPGAMSALIVMALDSDANPTFVTSFHFFRVVFIIITTPLIFKYVLRSGS